MLAAQNGHKTAVQLLFDTGKADINAKGSWGETPLMFGC